MWPLQTAERLSHITAATYTPIHLTNMVNTTHATYIPIHATTYDTLSTAQMN